MRLKYPVEKQQLPGALTADWTLAAYAQLCKAAQAAGYRTSTMEEYLRKPADDALILRHDVDRFPKNALRMADTEAELGLSSTYYLRVGVYPDVEVLAEKLSRRGHEIGYHFEVLSRADGDVRRAQDLFNGELEVLRSKAEVVTCAAHGSPLSKWNNQDFFNHCKPGDFGLLGDAYHDIDYSKVRYFTDTGRSWAATRTNLRDRVSTAETNMPGPNSTPDLIRRMADKPWPVICLQTHPERWAYSMPALLRSIAWDGAANSVKYMLSLVR